MSLETTDSDSAIIVRQNQLDYYGHPANNLSTFNFQYLEHSVFPCILLKSLIHPGCSSFSFYATSTSNTKEFLLNIFSKLFGSCLADGSFTNMQIKNYIKTFLVWNILWCSFLRTVKKWNVQTSEAYSACSDQVVKRNLIVALKLHN